jgi:hypothetical protein
VGQDGQCATQLAYAGDIPCLVCPEKQKQVYDFLDLMQNYAGEANRFNILFAGDKADMSAEQKQESKKDDKEQTDKPLTNDALKTFGEEFKDTMKKQIDDALKGVVGNHDAPESKLPTADKKDKSDEELIPKSQLEDIMAKMNEKVDKLVSKVEGLEGTVKTQNETIESYKSNEKVDAVGRMLLDYKDFFKSKDGKVDTEKFNNTLKYWAGKEQPIEKIGEDLKNSFEIASTYMNNYQPEIAKPAPQQQTESKKETKTEDKPLTFEEKRAKALDEYENERDKITAKVQTAGEDSDSDDIQADAFIRNRRMLLDKAKNNGIHSVVNNTETVY